MLPEDPRGLTESGIYQSRSKTEENQTRGKIVAVGDGDNVQRFKAGDVLIYQKFGPQDVLVEKEKHVIVDHDQILGLEK